MKIIVFIAVKYCSILHRCVCVIGCNVGSLWGQLFVFSIVVVMCYLVHDTETVNSLRLVLTASEYCI